MTELESIRGDFLGSLDHVQRALSKVRQHSGVHQILTFPDAHKIAEGLFLSAWTHWEEFMRELLVERLATDRGGALVKEVLGFRSAAARHRLAERVLGHPDPGKWVEWSDYQHVAKRASVLLGDSNPFSKATVPSSELELLKRMRNAIAHKSDQAWKGFLKLVSEPPFNLAANQRKGITVGRFLYSHNWNGNPVLETCLGCLRQASGELTCDKDS